MRIVIVGAGLAGLGAAYYLQLAGQEVVVLDRNPGPGLDTSYANGGLLHASLVEPWNAPGILGYVLRSLGREDSALLLRLGALPSLIGWGVQFIRHSNPERFRRNTRKNLALAQLSLAGMQELRRDTAIEYSQSFPGATLLFRPGGAAVEVRRSAAELASHGIANEWLDRAQLVQHEPALEPIQADLEGGIHFRSDEVGDAYQFCCALAGVLAARGAQLQYTTEVRDFEWRAGRIVAALTRAGAVSGDAFILAGGSASTVLAARAGLRLPVRPAKGYSITAARRDGDAGPKVPLIDHALHVAITPLGTERLRVVGTAELAGEDRTIRPARIQNLLSVLERTLPSFARQMDRTDLRPWAGLRPMSADGVPVLGRTRVENLYLNTGHGHLGWTLAAGSGRLVADTVLGRAPSLSLSDYELARF